jgi:integrase/recombinase XerD
MAVWFKNGRWVVQYYPNGRHGKQVRKVMPAHYTEEQARDHERIMLEGRRHRKDAEPEGRAFADFKNLYYSWMKAHRSPKTLQDVKNCFANHVMVHLGRVAIGDLSPGHFTTYKQLRKSDGGSNVSINKELAYFRGFCKYLAKEVGVMEPISFMTEKLPYERPKPKVLSDDEATKLLQAAGKEPVYQAFLLLEYGAGLRWSEARMLRMEDIDLDVKVPGRRTTIGHLRVKRKGGKTCILPVDGWPLEALRKAVGDRREGWVFPSPKDPNKPIWNTRGALDRAKTEAGIPKTRRIYNHLLRHSIATRMIKEKVPMRVIQDFLGHSQISMTEWYTQVMPEVLRENVITINQPKKKKANAQKTQGKSLRSKKLESN